MGVRALRAWVSATEDIHARYPTRDQKARSPFTGTAECDQTTDVDIMAGVCDNEHTMSEVRTPISDLLRETIRRAIESGTTNYKALQRETGVTRASIMRFVRGTQFLRLDMADKLAAFFGLELVNKKRKG
jgi:hypothetical protein